MRARWLLLFVVLAVLVAQHPAHAQSRRKVPKRPGKKPAKKAGADYYEILGGGSLRASNAGARASLPTRF